MKFPEHYKHLRSGFIVTLGDLRAAYAAFRETCSLFYVDLGKIGLADIQGVKNTGSFKEEFLLSANLYGLSPERLEYNPHISPTDNVYNLYMIYREALDTLATPLLSTPAPQLRAEEKDYFEDFVSLYKIWVELSRPIILSQQLTQSDKDMLKRLGEDFSLLDW